MPHGFFIASDFKDECLCVTLEVVFEKELCAVLLGDPCRYRKTETAARAACARGIAAYEGVKERGNDFLGDSLARVGGGDKCACAVVVHTYEHLTAALVVLAGVDDDIIDRS